MLYYIPRLDKVLFLTTYPNLLDEGFRPLNRRVNAMTGVDAIHKPYIGVVSGEPSDRKWYD